MSASLGEGLKKLIPEGKWQSGLAHEWVELWGKRHRGAPLPSVDTVEARLRECLQGRLAGIRYLFLDADRRDTTFDVLAATADDRERLGALAEEALRTSRPLRLVIDVTSGPHDGPRAEAMWEGLHRLLFGPDTLTPMALVLTEAQYDKLPRSFDDFGALVEFHKVASADASRLRVDELAALPVEGPLVASPTPRFPFERWAALRVDGDVALGPPDAIATFRHKGALEGLARVLRPLSRIAGAEGHKDLPTSDPPRLRKLAVALARGQVFLTPDWGPAARSTSAGEQEAPPVGVARRLSWARQLGVEAAATDEEWSTALPKRLAPVPVLEQSLLPHVLRHAAYTADAVVVLDGNLLHAVNPSERVRSELLGLVVEVHEIAPSRRPGLDAYFGAAAAMSADALVADPFLESLTAGFVTDEEDSLVLGQARTAVLLSGRLRPERALPASHWRSALRALLAEKQATKAALQLQSKGAEASQRGRSREGQEPAWSYFLRAGALLAEPAPWLLPIGPITATRDQVLWLVCPKDAHVPGAERAAEKTLQIPVLGEVPDHWSADFVAGLSPRSARGAEYRTAAPAITFSARQATKVELSPWVWDAADRELAFVLAALRAATVRAEELPLPSGNVLLPLGNGIFAELFVRADPSASSDTLEASLYQPFGLSMSRGIQADGALGLLPMYWAQEESASSAPVATQLGVRLPHAVYLAGRGVRVDVWFRSSGLLSSLPPLAALSAAFPPMAGARRGSKDDGDRDG